LLQVVQVVEFTRLVGLFSCRLSCRLCSLGLKIGCFAAGWDKNKAFLGLK